MLTGDGADESVRRLSPLLVRAARRAVEPVPGAVARSADRLADAHAGRQGQPGAGMAAARAALCSDRRRRSGASSGGMDAACQRGRARPAARAVRPPDPIADRASGRPDCATRRPATIRSTRCWPAMWRLRACPATCWSRSIATSMAHALETRTPFLDQRVVEWAFALPGSAKLALAGGRPVGKRILRTAFRDRLPRRSSAVPSAASRCRWRPC